MPKSPKTSSAAPYLRREGLAFLRSMVRYNNQDPEAARAWFQGNKATYEATAKKLAGLFNKNFETYAAGVNAEVKASAPKA